MMKIRSIMAALLPSAPFDALAVGCIDFKQKSFEVLEATNFHGEFVFKREPTLYFDLASLTKPLTNSLVYFLRPELFDQNMLLCLNHRGGLPAWGLLSRHDWKKQIQDYFVKESETLYSDFSSLRVMLELERKGVDQKSLCSEVWDKETLFWLDLPFWWPNLKNGYKEGRPNYGQVHDPNAWNLYTFCTHAGLFSTIDGLCQTLLNYQARTQFISKVSDDLKQHTHRFALGWDRVQDPSETLAGKGCGPLTFGHLGFTGTSIWIDPEKMLGHVILSNATKEHWYDKSALNDIRRAIGETIWPGSQ